MVSKILYSSYTDCIGASVFKSVLSSGALTDELLGTVVSLYTRDGRLYASILMPDETTFMRYVCVSKSPMSRILFFNEGFVTPPSLLIASQETSTLESQAKKLKSVSLCICSRGSRWATFLNHPAHLEATEQVTATMLR